MSWGNRIVCALCALCLAFTFVAVGFVAVAVPDTATTALSERFSGTTNDRTPFSADELREMALAGKRYTFDTDDTFALYQAIYDINASAAAAGRATRGALDTTRWDALASQDQLTRAEAQTGAQTTPFYALACSISGANANAGDTARLREIQPTPEHAEELLAEASEAYVLDAEAISHLNDVFRVAQTAEAAIIAALVVAVLTAVGVCCSVGRRAFGSVLACAGAIAIIAFAALGIWAAIDFEGLFAVFHSLFFASGSWVFSADSLLITMYPEPFWVGMGAIWLGATALASAAAIAIGVALKRA